MTQDERWLRQYEEMMTFMETNHRRPSKHRLEEHDMLNWFKRESWGTVLAIISE